MPGKWDHLHSVGMKRTGWVVSLLAPETFGCGAIGLNAQISVPRLGTSSAFHICVCRVYLCT